MHFISIGTRVGAGIIINGELYRGATNAAGEVAYFIPDVNIFRENGEDRIFKEPNWERWHY